MYDLCVTHVRFTYDYCSCTWRYATAMFIYAWWWGGGSHMIHFGTKNSPRLVPKVCGFLVKNTRMALYGKLL